MPLARRRYAPRRAPLARRAGGFAKRRYYRRGAAGRITRTLNPTPTFVETYRHGNAIQVPVGGLGVGTAFKVRISDIPQWLQYAGLYTQYRINWVKLMLIPDWNTSAADVNTGELASVVPTNYAGMARIAYAVQDSPNVAAPATEAEVLQDNGAKVVPIKTMFSKSFKPVPDVAQTTAVGIIPTKQRYKQWFNIDTALPGNNPEHGALTTFITAPGVSIVPGPAARLNFHVYFKVSFTLRDPK